MHYATVLLAAPAAAWFLRSFGFLQLSLLALILTGPLFLAWLLLLQCALLAVARLVRLPARILALLRQDWRPE